MIPSSSERTKFLTQRSEALNKLVELIVELSAANTPQEVETAIQRVSEGAEVPPPPRSVFINPADRDCQTVGRFLPNHTQTIEISGQWRAGRSGWAWWTPLDGGPEYGVRVELRDGSDKPFGSYRYTAPILVPRGTDGRICVNIFEPGDFSDNESRPGDQLRATLSVAQ
jgi:hypothetical protein